MTFHDKQSEDIINVEDPREKAENTLLHFQNNLGVNRFSKMAPKELIALGKDLLDAAKHYSAVGDEIKAGEASFYYKILHKRWFLNKEQ